MRKVHLVERRAISAEVEGSRGVMEEAKVVLLHLWSKLEAHGLP